MAACDFLGALERNRALSRFHIAGILPTSGQCIRAALWQEIAA